MTPTGDALYVGHLGTLAVARIDLTTFKFDRFIPAPRDTFELKVISGGRLAVNDLDQWTTPTLLDASSGAVLATTQLIHQGALATTGDGKTLFVGESSLSGSNLFRFDVSGNSFTRVSVSTYDSGYGFPFPVRSVVPLRDGSAVFYASYLLDGTNLAVLRYPLADRIRTVTPDGRLAISSTTTYAVADGKVFGALPVSAEAQALDRDGKTLYLLSGTRLSRVDLSGY